MKGIVRSSNLPDDLLATEAEPLVSRDGAVPVLVDLPEDGGPLRLCGEGVRQPSSEQVVSSSHQSLCVVSNLVIALVAIKIILSNSSWETSPSLSMSADWKHFHMNQ